MKSNAVKTICKSARKSLEWDKAIQEANDILDRVERRADRLRGAIRTFKECRDAGEPYSGQSATDLLSGRSGVNGR